MTVEILSAIESVVYAGYQCPVVRDSIVLEEPQAKLGQCQSVTFINAKDVLVYKFDQTVEDEQGKKIKEPFPFLDKKKPTRSKCDFLIFHSRVLGSGAKRLYVFICNMKSDEPGNVLDQFNSGEILGDFLIQTAIRCLNYWKSNVPSIPIDYRSSIRAKEIEYWRVSIANRKFPIQKGKTVPNSLNKAKHIECNKVHDFMELFH